MAWSDPSPRTRGRPAAAQPGYGAPEVRLPFPTIATRALVALCVAGCVYAILHGCAIAWLNGGAGPARLALDVALPLVLAVAVGWLVLRALLRRPRFTGLSDRVRNGGGWGEGSWADSDPTFAVQVGTDVVGDVVSAAIDIATD